MLDSRIDETDSATLERLDELGGEPLLVSIGDTIEDFESECCRWVTDDHAGENEEWRGKRLLHWRLISLAQAGDHVLAETEVEVVSALEGDNRGTLAVTVPVLVVLAEDADGWRTETREIRAPVPLSSRFNAALDYTLAHHARHKRKRTQIPYAAHVLAVASLVLEMESGSEDEAIAALLHDVVEDEGGTDAIAQIARRFGPDVLRIVLANSDTTVEPKPEWRTRKENYIAGIAHKAPDELRVSLADKLHNARAILFDYRRHGDAVWARFKVGESASVLWYYRSLAYEFQQRSQELGPGGAAAADELSRVVAELDRLCPG